MSLRLKTILGIAAIEAVLLVILIVTLMNYMRNSTEAGLVDYASTTSKLFATTTKDAVLSYDLASLDSFVYEILTNKAIRYVRVINADNILLVEGGDKALLAKTFVADDSLASVNDKIFDVSANIIESDVVYGSVQIGLSTESVIAAIDDARQQAIVIAVTEMVLVALFSFILGTYLTSQLKSLHFGARRIADGDLQHKVNVRGRDELAEVSHAFNKMTDSLHAAEQKRADYQRQLENLNAELEDRVKKRTMQLSDKNVELEGAYHQLKQTQGQLLQSEKMASIGQLAAGVAHEVNNPMGFIRSNLRSLQDYVNTYQVVIEHTRQLINAITSNNQQQTIALSQKIENICVDEDIEFLNEDIQDLMKDALDGAGRVIEIVQGLKDYSHVDQQELVEADINNCLETTLKVVDNEIKYKCNVQTELQPLPPLYCNPGQLNQVFTNLIVNAGQAIEDKGTIILSSHCDNNKIVVSVADTGKGIAKENLSKLFDPFFTTKPVGEGTGLGLSITHGIIQEHHGEIDVESELGIGTTFTITLPLQHVEHAI